ncbi:hypothetical protein ACJBU6_02672 [Exserohilum turcicum]
MLSTESCKVARIFAAHTLLTSTSQPSVPTMDTLPKAVHFGRSTHVVSMSGCLAKSKPFPSETSPPVSDITADRAALPQHARGNACFHTTNSSLPGQTRLGLDLFYTDDVLTLG